MCGSDRLSAVLVRAQPQDAGSSRRQRRARACPSHAPARPHRLPRPAGSPKCRPCRLPAPEPPLLLEAAGWKQVRGSPSLSGRFCSARFSREPKLRSDNRCHCQGTVCEDRRRLRQRQRQREDPPPSLYGRFCSACFSREPRLSSDNRRGHCQGTVCEDRRRLRQRQRQPPGWKPEAREDPPRAMAVRGSPSLYGRFCSAGFSREPKLRSDNPGNGQGTVCEDRRPLRQRQRQPPGWTPEARWQPELGWKPQAGRKPP